MTASERRNAILEDLCIGTLDIQTLRKRLVGIMNPNIVPNKIKQVDALARTASGKKLRK